jgi:hypothetical protein
MFERRLSQASRPRTDTPAERLTAQIGISIGEVDDGVALMLVSDCPQKRNWNQVALHHVIRRHLQSASQDALLLSEAESLIGKLVPNV